MFRRFILPCLGVLVFCSQNQAFGSQTKTCDCKLEKYEIAIKQINSDSCDGINGYNVIVTFRIQYQHVDDDETIATSKTYTKEYTVAATSKQQAEDSVKDLISTFGQEELDKQCKEKGCKTSK